jgi:hypothetical protein
MSSTPSKERPPLKRPTPRKRPASNPKFKTPPSSAKRRRLLEPASTLISKLRYQPLIMVFIDDSLCDKILSIDPDELIVVLSRQTFKMSVSVLQEVVGYLFTHYMRFERENEASNHSIKLLHRLACIACKLLESRRVFARRKSTFDTLVVDGGAFKAELVHIRDSHPPILRVTLSLKKEEALLNIEKTCQIMQYQDPSSMDSGDIQYVKKRMEDEMEKVVLTREKRASEHQAVTAKTSDKTTLYSNKPSKGHTNSIPRIAQTSVVKSILVRSEETGAKASEDKIYMLNKQLHEFKASIHSTFNAASTESMAFVSIVGRFDSAVNGWIEQSLNIKNLQLFGRK